MHPCFRVRSPRVSKGKSRIDRLPLSNAAHVERLRFWPSLTVGLLTLRGYRTRPLSSVGGDHWLLRQNSLSCNQRDQILIVDSLLSISQLRKASIYSVQLINVEQVAEFFVAQGQSVTAGVLAQHEFVSRNSDRLRRHDLVTERIADHAVLMYARFVRKRVAPDNRFVRLHAKSDDLREQLTGRINLARIDCGFERQFIGAHAHRHYDFFQRSIAGPLADAVHCAFDLSGPGVHCRQTVRYGQAEIVMAMHTDRDVFAFTNHAVAHSPYE